MSARKPPNARSGNSVQSVDITLSDGRRILVEGPTVLSGVCVWVKQRNAGVDMFDAFPHFFSSRRDLTKQLGQPFWEGGLT